MPTRLLTLLLLLTIFTPVPASDPPNIVFILADDLGVNDLHCYGRKEHRTPHLDQLAKDGLRFTSAYAAQSVCSPTRAAIMTGITPARLNITTFLPGRSNAPSQMLLHPVINKQLPWEHKTLSDRLHEAGYATACIGKWHLGGDPLKRGFDHYHPGKAATTPDEAEGGKGEFDLTIAAERFLDQHKNKSFFLYLCHNNPHIPLAAQPERIANFKETFNPLYAAMIESLDDSVGRILKKLDALNLRQNTIVIFTSDNGGLHVLEGGQTPTHNTPCRAGKGFLYEGGIRIPLIVRWPGKVEPGTVTDVPVISTDWTPTLLAATGINTKESFDGISLLDLLNKNKAPVPRPLYWHQPHYMNQGSRPSGAIMEDRWKLIEHYENGLLELFNLEKDISETTDVGDKEPSRVADLRGKLEKWRREIGVRRNTPNPQFNYRLWWPLYGAKDVSKWPTADSARNASLQLADWRKSMNAALGDNPENIGIGLIVLKPQDAIIHGEKLRFEPEPHKDTLGYWASMNDWVEWKFKVHKAGYYDIDLLQAAGKGSGGAIVEVTIADRTYTHTVKETGHFQRFVPITITTDSIQLKPGEYTLTIRPKTKPGFAVMDLRQVTLRGVSDKR